jgi:8-oxo-dGTP diphosphatase
MDHRQLTVLQVVGAAVLVDGKVLCAKRPPGGPIGEMWEFPGGKIEPGETHRQALVRECQEELGIIVQPKYELAECTMNYPHGLITLTTFLCDLVTGEPTLTEHAEIRWVSIIELHQLNWAPLDVSAVQQIQCTIKTP